MCSFSNLTDFTMSHHIECKGGREGDRQVKGRTVDGRDEREGGGEAVAGGDGKKEGGASEKRGGKEGDRNVR